MTGQVPWGGKDDSATTSRLEVAVSASPGTCLMVTAALAGSPYGCRFRLRLDGGGPGSESASIELPADRRGRVLAVVRVSAGFSSASIELQSPTGARIESAGLRPVSALTRTFLMLQRILAVWWRQRRNHSRPVLSLPDIVASLAETYERANRALRWAPAPVYSEWLSEFDRLDDADLSDIRSDIERWGDRPKFRIVVYPGASGDAGLERTLASIDGQLYSEFDVLRVSAADDARVRREFSEAGPGNGREWWLWVQGGDVLPRHALYWYAATIRRHPSPVAMYCDDDELDSEGRRCRPRFKPDWSPRYFRAQDYVGEGLIVERRAVLELWSSPDEVVGPDGAVGILRAIVAVRYLSPERIVHVPAILRHRSPENAHRKVRAGADHVPGEGLRPRVTIIVPTRNGLGLLRCCLDSIQTRTRYPDYDVIVIDNGSDDPETLRYLGELADRSGVEIVRDESPFNYSRLNNAAVRSASGEVVVLLNNDTEVLTPEWLSIMIDELHAVDADGRRRVGVVGAKLLYPSGQVQHAGIGVGISGCADHLHAWIDGDDPGYCGRAVLPHEVSAVTGACLMTWRDLYLSLGGLDEENLQVAFNDVDYCLRVRAAGRRVVFTPHAKLVHHESATRKEDVSIAARRRTRREADYMSRRWQGEMQNDPFYNPNLTHARPDFSLSPMPRVQKPWRGN